MKMRKLLAVPALALTLALSMTTMSGCSSNSSVTETDTSDAGTYIFDSLSDGEDALTAQDLEDLGMDPADMYITLNTDGTGKMCVYDDEEELTWKKGELTGSDNVTIKYTIENGKLTMEEDGATMTFVKQD